MRQPPILAIFTVGDDDASKVYVRNKIKAAEEVGIIAKHYVITKEQYWQDDFLWDRIKDAINEADGVILQKPVAYWFPDNKFLEYLPYWKDVDGLVRDSLFKPCTPEGILHLLERELGNLSGKTVLIIGRGKLVGMPLFNILLDEDCTVTMAHSKTKDLNELLQQPFDIVVSAVGKPKLINLQLCNAKIVIDVGVNRDENGKLCGDCYNFDENVKPDMLVTPVPKGIGLMTRAMLMWHVHQTAYPVKM